MIGNTESLLESTVEEAQLQLQLDDIIQGNNGTTTNKESQVNSKQVEDSVSTLAFITADA
jgi:hypothetical protein